MKFVCDSCHAQYMISDDKVGANGVKVRCKKCSNVIVVKKVVEPDPTMVMQNPLAQAASGGPAPFDGLGTDEIGQAFDSVLTQSGKHGRLSADDGDEPTQAANVQTQLDVPVAAAGLGDNTDRDSTRVMDLKAVAGLAAASESTSLNEIPDAIKAQGYVDGKNGELNGHANGANGAAAGPVPQTDWYVAINEEQQGPLTLEVVKGHWEAGRVTSDSLVWRNGYTDWKPLSSIPELVKVLTPIPTPRKVAEKPAEPEASRPAGATANGPQVPFVAPAPAAVPDPDEVDWKPAAASALASLVADEMEALSKPAAKAPVRAEPVGVGETTGMKPVLANLEAPPESSSPALEAQSSPALESPAPVAARSRLPDHSPEPLVRPIPPAYPSSPELSVYPAPSSYVPAAHGSNNTKYIVAGVGVVVVCLTAVGITYLLASRPAPVAQPAAPVVAMNTPQPAQPAAPTQPETHPTPTAAAAPVQPAAQPVPPTQPAAPVAAQPVAAKAAPEKDAHVERSERVERHHSKHGREVAAAAAEPSGGGEEISAPSAPSRPQKPQHESSDDLLSAGGKSKVDSDFDKLLGGGSSEPAAPAAKKKHGNDVYIPPAVSNLPEQLGQGDIMSVVAGHKGQIVGCINKQRASGGDSSGVVKMHWVIQRSGGVSGVSVVGSEFRSAPIGKCMTGTIRGWRFPQFSGAPMPIDFPFKF